MEERKQGMKDEYLEGIMKKIKPEQSQPPKSLAREAAEKIYGAYCDPQDYDRNFVVPRMEKTITTTLIDPVVEELEETKNKLQWLNTQDAEGIAHIDKCLTRALRMLKGKG